MLDAYIGNPLLAGTAIFVLGLCIGSLLNIVIDRLPVILERQWRLEAGAILDLSPAAETPSFNLITRHTRCLSCNHRLQLWEHLPVLSWLLWRGKCIQCKAAISARYPLVELTTGLLSLLIFAMFGPTGKMLSALVLTWALIALTVIDFNTQYLLDIITLPLMWLGLLINTTNMWVPLESAVLGAAVGYLSLWSIYWLFKILTGKESLGYGDFKLMAALGAWLGPSQLPFIILASSLAGSVVGGIYLAIRKKNLPFAFGPYLAIAGFGAVIFGTQLLDWYVS